MNSQHLQDMVDVQAIPEWVAEKLDHLSSEEKKRQATERLKAVVEEAVNNLCNQIDSPALAPVEPEQPAQTTNQPSSDILTAVREDLLDRYFPGSGRVGTLIRHHISQGWDSGQKKTAFKWFAVMAAAWFFWSPILWVLRTPLRWYHRRFTSEVRTEFRNLGTRPATETIAQPEVSQPTAMPEPQAMSAPGEITPNTITQTGNSQ